MTGWHLLLNVAVQKSIERHTGRPRILRLLIQLHDEAFEMLTNSLLSFVDGRVEGLHLADSPAALDHVIAEFPGETLGSFHAANRTLLVAVGGRIQHGKPSL
jgi:hypothetical protein